MDQTKELIRQFRVKRAAETAEHLIGKDEERPTTLSAIQKITSLKLAEHWRNVLLREIMRSITKIQSRSIGSDHQIKMLNDSINQMVREKNHWDNRIRQLGGQVTDRRSNLTSISTLPGVLVDNTGRPIPVSGPSSSSSFYYKYYGRAAELPGVKERLHMVSTMYHPKKEEDEPEEQKDRPRDLEELTLSKISGKLTAEYFGLIPIDFSIKQDGSLALPASSLGEHTVPLYYPFESLPTQDQIESYLIERKKEHLLNLYGC